jgi:hypothetical protein
VADEIRLNRARRPVRIGTGSYICWPLRRGPKPHQDKPALHILTALRRVGYTPLLGMHHLEQAPFGRAPRTGFRLSRAANSAWVETPGSEAVDLRDWGVRTALAAEGDDDPRVFLNHDNGCAPLDRTRSYSDALEAFKNGAPPPPRGTGGVRAIGT